MGTRKYPALREYQPASGAQRELAFRGLLNYMLLEHDPTKTAYTKPGLATHDYNLAVELNPHAYGTGVEPRVAANGYTHTNPGYTQVSVE